MPVSEADGVPVCDAVPDAVLVCGPVEVDDAKRLLVGVTVAVPLVEAPLDRLPVGVEVLVRVVLAVGVLLSVACALAVEVPVASAVADDVRVELREGFCEHCVGVRVGLTLLLGVVGAALLLWAHSGGSSERSEAAGRHVVRQQR